jgi:tetratricopeptide (TPR) repeat protein
MDGAPLQSLRSAASRSFRDVPAGNFGNAMFYMNDHSVRKWKAVTTGILGQFLRRGVLFMRSVLWGLLGLVLCLPLAFVLLLVVAARYPAMDAFTTKLPDGIQATVADLILQKAGYGKDSAKAIDRALRFDPQNPDAWSRRCHGSPDEKTADQATCRKAIALEPTASNFNGLGAAQEQAKDFCAAEDSYTNAIREATNDAYYLRNMARAALRCGHTGASVAGFEVAEGLDAKAAADPDEDDDVKTDLLSDREYLAVAYDRTNQPVKGTAICTKAHTDWKICHCELTETSVRCSDAPPASLSKNEQKRHVTRSDHP